ncbi:MAG: hypothetical protein ACFB22_08265 [Rhodothalassiaceae bacterium]
MREKPRILISFSGGGWGFQTRKLIHDLKDRCEFLYAIPENVVDPIKAGCPDGISYRIPKLRSFTRGVGWRTPGHLLTIFLRSRRFIAREKPDAVVVLGLTEGLVVLAAAKLCGCRTVYIESITRVSTPSATLRLCSRLRLADTTLVQWPSLATKVPGASYGGTIL